MASTNVSSQEQKILSEVSRDQLMGPTQAIAQWVRLSGTPDEAKAFDWIDKRLTDSGLQTTRYQHPALVSWPESASLTATLQSGESISIPCSTHAFARSTSENGIERELVYVGRGSAEELASAAVEDKIVLVDGIVAPNRNLVVENANVAASIWIAGTYLHERGLSPIWGTPTPETAHLLPTTPSVSVTAENGDRLKQLLDRGLVRVKLTTEVYRAWHMLPLLIGELPPSASGAEPETFVMLSGHVDSWYYGAMDNGTANATMIEVGRILSQHREQLRRGLRLAFWSGHSHARYAGSAWYADNFWHELHDHCVAHINVDSVGGQGATVLSQGNSMEELRAFVSDAIEPIAGQRLDPRRYGRSGDQSFWGHGVPAALMSLSEQPPENADPVLLALHHQISGGASKSGGLGWWWHLPDDTVDKIDPELLERDASIYVLLLYRLCSVPVLPLDYRPVVEELRKNVKTISEKTDGHFDLAPVIEQLDALSGALEAFYAEIGSVGPEHAAAVNNTLMAVGRALIPVDFTRTGQFDHDLAVPTQPIPALQPAASLVTMPADSDDYHFLKTRLIRERNRIVRGLIEATRAIESANRHQSS